MKETCLTSALPFLSGLWHQYHQFYSGAVSGIENKHLIKIWDMYGSKIQQKKISWINMGNVAFNMYFRDITNINLPSLTAEFGQQVFLPAL